MNTQGLLDKLLQAGQQLIQKKTSGSDPTGVLQGSASKAAAIGALGLLLGSKRARHMSGKALSYGGLAALGVLAYKAYGNWQEQQRFESAKPVAEPQTIDRLPIAEAELHSQAILTAMVAAAKADGHIDEQERLLIEEQVAQLDNDPALLKWLDAELNKPLNPVEVAKAAKTPEMAAEMYLASVLLIDEENYMEQVYLDELARQLQLAPALKTQLEAQLRQAQA